MSIQSTISKTIDSFADSQFNFASEQARNIVTKVITDNLIIEQYEPYAADMEREGVATKPDNLILIDKDDLELMIAIKKSL